MKGGCHRQGSLTLVGHIQKGLSKCILHSCSSRCSLLLKGVTLHVSSCSLLQKRETGVEPSVFTVWSKKRTLSEPDPERGGSTWMNDGNDLRDTKYREKFSEVHGPNMDPLDAPFDAEVAVLAGHGKRNGRLWIGDGSVDTVTIPSLRQLCRGRKSSQPRVETRPTPSSVAMDRIRVCSSSWVIYISLHVFHCNIHNIAKTKCSLRWRSKLHCERRPRPSLGEWKSR